MLRSAAATSRSPFTPFSHHTAPPSQHAIFTPRPLHTAPPSPVKRARLDACAARARVLRRAGGRTAGSGNRSACSR
eukprot:scaffold5125_cov134-Isochrysis_galbana.AAC.11